MQFDVSGATTGRWIGLSARRWASHRACPWLQGNKALLPINALRTTPAPCTTELTAVNARGYNVTEQLWGDDVARLRNEKIQKYLRPESALERCF